MVGDPYELLIAACKSHGLAAVRYREPPRVRVSEPGSPSHLVEEVTLSHDGGAFLFSWGELIGPVDEPNAIAARLKRVVSVSCP